MYKFIVLPTTGESLIEYSYVGDGRKFHFGHLSPIGIVFRHGFDFGRYRCVKDNLDGSGLFQELEDYGCMRRSHRIFFNQWNYRFREMIL